MLGRLSSVRSQGVEAAPQLPVLHMAPLLNFVAGKRRAHPLISRFVSRCAASFLPLIRAHSHCTIHLHPGLRQRLPAASSPGDQLQLSAEPAMCRHTSRLMFVLARARPSV